MSEAAPPPDTRLASLDALRGFAMLGIVGGDALAGAFGGLAGGAVTPWLSHQFSHTEWAGLTFYDLIFPLFIFVVGAAVPLSLDRLVEREGRPIAMRRVLLRGLVMFLLGVFYYGGIAQGWAGIRWVGVLQRLAVCYVAAGVLHLWLAPRARAVVLAGLLVGYWALLTFVPVPGFGTGDYARGHNLANWIDAHWLPGKVWYGDYDPEGLLSTLPAIATCLLGGFAGGLLRDPSRSGQEKAGRLALAGLMLIAVGALWSLQFPVIKRIWTSSYALVTGGGSALLLATFYWMIDLRGWRRWARPLEWIGANALLLYLLSHFLDFRRIATFFAGGEIGSALDASWPGLGGFLQALVGIGLCVGVGGWLYTRKIFIRL